MRGVRSTPVTSTELAQEAAEDDGFECGARGNPTCDAEPRARQSLHPECWLRGYRRGVEHRRAFATAHTERFTPRIF